MKSYFASQYIQVGPTEHRNDALRLMSELTLAFSSMDGFEVASGLNTNAADTLMLRQTWQQLRARHNPDAYGTVSNLGAMLDGGALATFMLNIHSECYIAGKTNNAFGYYHTFEVYQESTRKTFKLPKIFNM